MNKQYLATVRPEITNGPTADEGTVATAFGANDLLFDWHRFEIPMGEACIKNFNIIMPGTNSRVNSDENLIDFTFWLARSVDGHAPPSLGTVNSSMTGGPAKIAFTLCRNHIVHTQTIDASLMANPGTYEQSYRIYTSATMNTAAATQAVQVANALPPGGVNIGNSKYTGNYNDSTSQPGMQSFWIGGITHGGHDFGTGCLLNQGSGQAAVPKSTTSETTLTVDTVDANQVFSRGDKLTVGVSGAIIGTVTEVVSATEVKVDHVQDALANNDEICVLNPIIFNFGIEY